MVKWNSRTKKYEPYRIPEEWYTPLLADAYKTVNCASCGKEIKYGNSFVSLEIRESEISNVGYAVCDACFNLEFERKVKEHNKPNKYEKRYKRGGKK